MLTSLADAAQKYSSGGVKTHDTFKYGRFSVRMRASTKKGTISSFFTYWEGRKSPSKSGWNEIDIEIIPSMKDPFGTNIHSNGSTNLGYIDDFNPYTAWNDYEIEWKPDSIAWKINGEQVRKV